MTQTATSTQIQLVSRPTGWPTAENFRTVTVELPALGPGQVRVENEFMSVDPYMRGRMNDVKSYTPPFALDETMTGGAVGRVVESTSGDVPVGAVVVHQLGWRDVAQGDAAGFRVVPEVEGVPSSAYLSVLGMTALTAYVGLLEIAHLSEGDTVFVSGAAGAVGSMVGQIARLRGAARVVGSAGSAEKVALLTERYGFDAAFSYKDGDVAGQLAAAAPDGIDVYFDNVGSQPLESLQPFQQWHRTPLPARLPALVGTTRLPALFLLSRLRLPDSRVISHSGCAAENMPLRQRVLCPSNLHGCLRFSFLNKIFLIRLADWVCVSFVFSGCRVFVMAVIQFDSLFFPFFFYDTRSF